VRARAAVRSKRSKRSRRTQARAARGPCPFVVRRRTIRRNADGYSLDGIFGDVAIRPGAVVVLELRRTGTTGRIYSFTMRSTRLPRRSEACIDPVTAKPEAC
jgi:hypothetical protein